jgi:hypothetical protein
VREVPNCRASPHPSANSHKTAPVPASTANQTPVATAPVRPAPGAAAPTTSAPVATAPPITEVECLGPVVEPLFGNDEFSKLSAGGMSRRNLRRIQDGGINKGFGGA